jgi:RNA polymerase II subunit A small phosphatase-like protein
MSPITQATQEKEHMVSDTCEMRSVVHVGRPMTKDSGMFRCFLIRKMKDLLPPQKTILEQQRQLRGISKLKTLVLDLDETLIHASFERTFEPDFTIRLPIRGCAAVVYIKKRPGVDEFLEFVGSRFETVVFTASLALYANPVLDMLDPNKNLIHSRLFRNSCTKHRGSFVKDLSRLGRPLSRTIIIDNSPIAYSFQPENAIPCDSYFGVNRKDTELLDIMPLLSELMGHSEVYNTLSTITRDPVSDAITFRSSLCLPDDMY